MLTLTSIDFLDMELELMERLSSRPSGGTGRNIIVFEADMSLFVYADNKERHFNSQKSPTQRLGEHSLAAKKTYQNLIFF